MLDGMAHEDENETVVIDHPGTLNYRGELIPHTHSNREVICKRGTKSITLEPIINYNAKHTYQRTGETDVYGRSIFREESA